MSIGSHGSCMSGVFLELAGCSVNQHATIAGEGEFGVVHKAIWNGTLVAVKTLKQSSEIALADFRSEIDTLRKVHHPNAVQFLGARSKTEPYMLITGGGPQPARMPGLSPGGTVEM